MLIYKVFEGNWFCDEPLSIIYLLASLIGIQFAWFIPPGKVQGVILGCNPPTWFIDSLLLCIVIMTFLVWLSDKTHINIIWSFAFMVLIGVYGYWYGLDYPLLNWASFRGYYAYFFGIILALYERKITQSYHCEILRYVTICILMVGAIFLYKHGCMKVFILSFFLFPSLILLSTVGFIRKSFSNIWWAFLCDVSYEVYLCHFSFVVIFIILRNYGVINNEFANSSYLCIALYTMFVWIISSIIYNIVEKNLLRKIVVKIN